MQGSTIAAIATPPGAGGIAVVRLSGAALSVIAYGDATSPERGRFCSTYRQMAKSSPFGGAAKRSEAERVYPARNSPSHLALLDARFPFLSLRDIFPRSGGSHLRRWGLWHGGEVFG